MCSSSACMSHPAHGVGRPRSSGPRLSRTGRMPATARRCSATMFSTGGSSTRVYDWSSATVSPVSEQRHDLGAAFAWLTRAMIKAEEPVLRAHDVEMWDYVVLATLARGPASTQSELAAASGRDKTRLIPILDRLEARGLLR